MSTRTAEFFNQTQTFQTQHLNLSYSHNNDLIKISLQIKSPRLTTRSFPQTLEIIEKIIPSVLSSQCFNDLNLPFSEEVKATEIGHLLEHIILEYLCLEKMDNGSDEADFSGETSWNWIRDPQGTFDITIECSIDDYIFFFPALEKSIRVLEEILVSRLGDKPTHQSFQPTYSSVPTLLS